MVDLEHQFGLPLFRTPWHRHHPRRKLMSMQSAKLLQRSAISVGWISNAWLQQVDASVPNGGAVSAAF
jgi:hypothetical protein